ncbi:MAG: FG-GAP repeat protein [Saprospiraceae bacterium]|nr:FG-GAP repeat protein [Saprospiraceae bacterium]
MIGVNNTSMQATLDVGGEIRLGDSGRNPVAGMIQWNDDTQDFEGYNGSKWISLTQSNVQGQFGKLKPSELNEDHKLTASDGAMNDLFGFSVSISGDYAVIGAPQDDNSGNEDQGSAYIFQHSGTSWTQQAKLTASDGAADDRFGMSVSISGDYALIGAEFDNYNQGSAYIFHRNGTAWTQQAILTALDAANKYFGVSVSISGDYAIIGAHYDNIGINFEQGSAYIFNRSGTVWTQQAKLTASDGAANDKFGWSVSISGDYAVIGAPKDDIGSNTAQGSAYIFNRSGTVWTQQAKLTASDGAANDKFGWSVSISGDYAVIGASYDDIGGNTDQGSAYVFNRTGTTWTQQASLTASDGAANDYFGYSVSISGDYAVIGAYLDDIGSNANQGSAYVFNRSGTSWTQQASLTASDGAANDYFGHSVSISGDYAVVGAYYKHVVSIINQGSAYIVEKK